MFKNILIGIAVLAGFIAANSFMPKLESSKRNPDEWASNLRGAAELFVERGLRDPSSAQFRNIQIYTSTNPNERIACGEVNYNNAFGGKVGFSAFVVTITNEGGNLYGKPAIFQGLGLGGGALGSGYRQAIAELCTNRAPPPAPAIAPSSSTGPLQVVVITSSEIFQGASRESTVIRRTVPGEIFDVFSNYDGFVYVGVGRPIGWVLGERVKSAPSPELAVCDVPARIRFCR